MTNPDGQQGAVAPEARPSARYIRAANAVSIMVFGVLAGVFWLVSGFIILIGSAPSSSDSENMNGLVLLLMPYALLPALAFTDMAVLIAQFQWRGPVVRTVGAIAVLATVLGVVWLLQEGLIAP
jgi:hypothetical protein